LTYVKNNHISISDENRSQAATIVALISCLSIYGVTISLFTPLLSLLLEQRGTSSTAIGVLAMSAPTGVLIGSFLMPRVMKAFEGRNLLVGGVLVEILLIGALMATDSFAGWMLIRFLAGLTGTVLFIVSETWLVEIAPARSRGKIMGLYNTALALSFSVGPLILSYTGVIGATPFVVAIILMAVAGAPLFFAGRYRSVSAAKPRFGIIGFVAVAPLLVFAIFAGAFKDLASASLMPVYGLRMGMTESSAALMLFFGALGGAIMQLPIGWAADHFSARRIFFMCAVMGVLGAVAWPLMIHHEVLLWTMLFLWAGFYAGFYTVAMILAGQWFKGSELATAMSAFGVFWGLGAFAGPLVGGLAMDIWNPYGLPLVLSIVSIGVLAMSLAGRAYQPKRSSQS